MSNRKELKVPEKFNKYKNENGYLPLYSFSKISSFGDGCQYEYYLSRILKKEGRTSSYAVLGTIAHDILERYYNGEIKRENMVSEFENKWLELQMDNIKLSADEDKNDKMVEDYKSDILSFFKTHKSLGKVLTERQVWIDIEGNVFFGYIDGMTKDENGKVRILDWKTSTIYKGQEIINHQRQLLLYAIGINQLGIPIENITIEWNFLKYYNIRFNHMVTVTYTETVKDKINEKTSTCYKDEWVSKVKTQLKKDIASHYEAIGDTKTNKELKEMVDTCVEQNSLISLPKEVQILYKVEDIVKTARRSRWAKESTIQTQIKKDLIKAGIDEISAQISLMECVEQNSLEPLKDKIDISNYIFEDAYVNGIINDETINELKTSLVNNIKALKEKGKEESYWERVPIQKEEEFYCNVLCSQRNNCKYYKQFKEEQELFFANEFKTSEVDDDLLNQLLDL